MARYIDADKVMEEIASMGGHDLCEWSTLGVKVLINRQPTADVAPRAEWISVEERLPESNDRCIVWYFDYIWRIRFASYNSGTKRWYVVCGGEIKDTKRDGVNVTHWMPMPQPPKGDHHE